MFRGQYISFVECGCKNVFWNLVTWYNFFKFNKIYDSEINWYPRNHWFAELIIIDKANMERRTILFGNEIPVLQDTYLRTYKQINGDIYEITLDTHVI